MINNLDVYPNPTNGIFNISFVSEEIQTLQLRVIEYSRRGGIYRIPREFCWRVYKTDEFWKKH